MPCPLGKEVVTTSFVDANLYHDLISSRSDTGCLHMINKILIDWFSKLQSTVETTTFGSKYIAARTCMEQIIYLRNTLRYLGVPSERGVIHVWQQQVCGQYSFNTPMQSSQSGTICCSITRQGRPSLPEFHHVMGKQNPVDILSTHWNMPSIWDMLWPLLFWRFQPPQEDQMTVATAEDESCAHQGECQHSNFTHD